MAVPCLTRSLPFFTLIHVKFKNWVDCVWLLFWTHTQKWGRFKAGHFLDQFIRLTWKLGYYETESPYGNRMQSFFKVGGSSVVLDSFVPIGMMVNDLSLDKSNNTLDQHHRTASIVYISENRSWTFYSRPKLAHLSQPS